MEVPKPTKSMSREELVEWLDEWGDEEARGPFVDAAFDPKAKKLTKAEVYDLCAASYGRIA